MSENREQIHLRGWGRPFAFAFAAAAIVLIVELWTTHNDFCAFWHKFFSLGTLTFPLLAAVVERMFAFREFRQDEATLKALRARK